ncbi:hypothetical protein NXT08_06920 [Rhodococcus pyridinivorans]|uniref:Uncharacterized protein n=3 Tax=Rhodococcus pyridinivorans TaxID=103816 RepID=V9XIR3_9NOCA|nr:MULTISPECIES: hypothetical protein [Rhodococcus]AHD23346.1 hypothetical protein Y013_23410 [Rhodococcus pyridinivorans SB3094]AOD22382.1 hypothetical protein IM25_12820 [Rhodococcus sp. p52]EHK81414.1 hypothetical protein AK37_20244 [Rhodococcus pyridinivorans AK37]MBX4167755.1 hypothetical protein [Rhodococcus sp. DMU2021]MCD2141149.1 hypothetical protein [Rhodococcus pyridinivorans]
MTNPDPDTDMAQARLRVRIGEASSALLRLDEAAPGTAGALVALVQVIADEAARTPRFARALAGALSVTADASAPTPAPAPATRPAAARTSARRSRRAPGAFDPFVVFRESGEATLRERLSTLGVEQLKDIIAEHAMDYDKLAMRWRTPSKLQDRIVERVKALTTKGDAFR